LDESSELGIGHLGAIHPEARRFNGPTGSFARFEWIAHFESAAGDPHHVGGRRSRTSRIALRNSAGFTADPQPDRPPQELKRHNRGQHAQHARQGNDTPGATRAAQNINQAGERETTLNRSSFSRNQASDDVPS